MVDKRKHISTAERKRRADRMRRVAVEGNEKRALQKEAEEKAEAISFKERAFIDKYIWGEPEISGKAKECYIAVYGEESSKTPSSSGMRLLRKKPVAKYLDKQMKEFELIMRSEKIKNLQALIKIRDECASVTPINRFGDEVGVAALRNTSIKAAESINKMMSFNAPEEVNVNHNAAGITFNLIVPEKKIDNIIDIDCEDISE